MREMIQPGSRIGILGGGQLGRMMGIAAREMGYHLNVYDPSAECVACAVADSMTRATWDDTAALEAFAANCDIVTLEFENVDVNAIRTIAAHVPVYPGAEVLEICQNRLRERAFLEAHGYPQPRHAAVRSPEDLAAAMASLGTPCVLKTIALGYDGKGQVRVNTGDDAALVWREWGGSVGIVEEFVDFDCELSALCTRSLADEVRCFPVPRNSHWHHILDTSLVPCGLPDEIQREASVIGESIARQLGCVGMLAVEFFHTKDGRLLVNELAPRPHNSGHFTMNGCITSQFEQHVRAVCNLPLGETFALNPCGMWNLLGDLWENGEPQWWRILENPNAKLHLYGKSEARTGRKMGHVNVLGRTGEEVEATIQRLRQAMLPEV